MAARMVSIYASDDRVKVQSISEKAKILEVKAQAKVALKEKLGMGDESFHPTAQSDDDVRVIVPTKPHKILRDSDTVEAVCTERDDYLLAIVPSAPAAGSPGNFTPKFSLLFPLKGHPNPIPTQSASSSTAVENSDGNQIQKLILDIELLKHQRKEDAEKAERRLVEDAEKAERRLKEEVGEEKRQRKKELEEEKRQRKKELEEEKRQRKKELEEERHQRKKDRAAADENDKDLKNKITELEDTLKRTKKDAEVERQETQRYIESFVDDATDFLTIGDEGALDRIKRRNLLDRAQAMLAVSLGIASSGPFASSQFREALGPSSSPDDRKDKLRQMLMDKKDKLSGPEAELLNKPETLNLLADRHHRVRLDGNEVAHRGRERGWYENAVVRSGKFKVALLDLLDFVFSETSGQ